MNLLINSAIIEQAYLPKLLPYREEQHQYLAFCIKPLMNGRTGTNLLVVGAPGIGKCIPGSTPILLSNGEIKTIKELYEANVNENGKLNLSMFEDITPSNGIEILTLDVNSLNIIPQKVSYLYHQQYYGNLICITTNSGREVLLTPDHPILTFNCKSPEYKAARFIKVNDFIGIPRFIKMMYKNNNSLPKIEYRLNEKRIKIPSISTEFARFIGFLISEGNTEKQSIRFFNENENFISEFEKLSKELFGLKSKVYREKNKTPYVRVHSTALIRFLNSIEKNLTKKSTERSVPDVLLNSSNEITSNLLRALFDAEGSFYKAVIEFSTSSKLLINQVAYLLLRFGIVGRIKKSYKLGKDRYRLLILGIENLNRFYKNIGFSDEKQTKLISFISKNKNPNTNVDIIPNISELVQKLVKKSRIYVKGTKIRMLLLNLKSGKNVSRKRIKIFIKMFDEHLEKISKICEKIKMNSNIEDLNLLRKNLKISWRAIAKQLSLNENTLRYYVRENHKLLLRYTKAIKDFLLIETAKVQNDKEMIEIRETLVKLSFSHIFWDKIKKIKIISKHDENLYDLHVPNTHNFIGGNNGMILHNTACTRFILRKLMEETENLMPIYVNCWKRDTSSKIINDIADQMDLKLAEKTSSDEIFDKLVGKFNKYDGVIFAFDEIDKVNDFDFLYRIIEDVPRKTIFLITNVSDWIAKMDRRLMSRLLLDRIEFKPYKFEEIRGILYERQKYAFAPKAWDYDAFENIIRKTFTSKDIRIGLFLMKVAAETAEARNAIKIDLDDVNKAIEKLKDFYDTEDKESF